MIGALDVLKHVREDTVVLGQMHRAVGPGGGILLTVPQHEFLWSRTDERACRVRRYATRDQANKVRRTGFRVGRLMNSVLENILTVERAGIRAGLRFPFGGSLLLVAKKKSRDRDVAPC